MQHSSRISVCGDGDAYFIPPARESRTGSLRAENRNTQDQEARDTTQPASEPSTYHLAHSPTCVHSLASGLMITYLLEFRVAIWMNTMRDEEPRGCVCGVANRDTSGGRIWYEGG